MKLTPTRSPAPADCAYLAGIIDGEGSIMAYRTRHDQRTGRAAISIQLAVDISNTDMRLMEWLAARWAGCLYTANRGRYGQKDTHHFVVRDLAAPVILAAALPYLVLKREQAEIVLELAASKRNHGRRGYPPGEKERRLALAARVQELNLKGTRPRGVRGDRHDPGRGAAAVLPRIPGGPAHPAPGQS